MNASADNVGITQPIEGHPATALAPDCSACMVVVQGKDIGRRFILRAPRTTIGRALEADVVLHDEGVSRMHCCIARQNGGYVIEDLKSRNGTFVEAHPIQCGNLPLGAPVRVGHTLFHIEGSDPAETGVEDDLFHNATTDPLTGVANRRLFIERAAAELPLARRTYLPIAMLRTDVDGFRSVNARYGRAGGDKVLLAVARLLATRKRCEDLLGRIGGDEFACMLRGSLKANGVIAFCNRIRDAVQSTPVEHDGQRIAVTISTGICFMAAGEYRTLEDLMALAGETLCRARTKGHNLVECHLLGNPGN